MNFHRLIMGTAIVLWLAYAAWTINTPEQEPECKPVPQLSEILK